jgi:hypothetical protein
MRRHRLKRMNDSRGKVDLESIAPTVCTSAAASLM